MAVLRSSLLLALIGPLFCLHLSVAGASTPVSQDGESYDPRKELIKEQAKKLCRSTDEYIKTLKFLRTTKEIILPEHSARLIAEKVSKGCNGSSERFTRNLRLLKNVGLSDPKSLELSLLFSGYPAEWQDNFAVVFTKSYLSEFYDYDYTTAVKLAFELSRDYQGDANEVRDDFIALSKFCKESRSVELPVKICADIAVKLARLSELYPEGIRKPFTTLYTKLREDKDFSLDVKTALDVAYNVLKNGPTAPDNFLSAYAYSMKEDGLASDRKKSLHFALKMAVRSYIGDEPPAIPAVTNDKAE
jgi:hypothetical protein